MQSVFVGHATQWQKSAGGQQQFEILKLQQCRDPQWGVLVVAWCVDGGREVCGTSGMRYAACCMWHVASGAYCVLLLVLLHRRAEGARPNRS